MKHHGWRKPTPGLGIAEQYAQAGEQVAVPKNKGAYILDAMAAAPFILGLTKKD